MGSRASSGDNQAGPSEKESPRETARHKHYATTWEHDGSGWVHILDDKDDESARTWFEGISREQAKYAAARYPVLRLREPEKLQDYLESGAVEYEDAVRLAEVLDELRSPQRNDDRSAPREILSKFLSHHSSRAWLAASVHTAVGTALYRLHHGAPEAQLPSIPGDPPDDSSENGYAHGNVTADQIFFTFGPKSPPPRRWRLPSRDRYRDERPRWCAALAGFDPAEASGVSPLAADPTDDAAGLAAILYAILVKSPAPESFGALQERIFLDRAEAEKNAPTRGPWNHLLGGTLRALGRPADAASAWKRTSDGAHVLLSAYDAKWGQWFRAQLYGAPLRTRLDVTRSYPGGVFRSQWSKLLVRLLAVAIPLLSVWVMAEAGAEVDVAGVMGPGGGLAALFLVCMFVLRWKIEPPPETVGPVRFAHHLGYVAYTVGFLLTLYGAVTTAVAWDRWCKLSFLEFRPFGRCPDPVGPFPAPLPGCVARAVGHEPSSGSPLPANLPLALAIHNVATSGATRFHVGGGLWGRVAPLARALGDQCGPAILDTLWLRLPIVVAGPPKGATLAANSRLGSAISLAMVREPGASVKEPHPQWALDFKVTVDIAETVSFVAAYADCPVACADPSLEDVIASEKVQLQPRSTTAVQVSNNQQCTTLRFSGPAASCVRHGSCSLANAPQKGPSCRELELSSTAVEAWFPGDTKWGELKAEVSGRNETHTHDGRFNSAAEVEEWITAQNCRGPAPPPSTCPNGVLKEIRDVFAWSGEAKFKVLKNGTFTVSRRRKNYSSTSKATSIGDIEIPNGRSACLTPWARDK